MKKFLVVIAISLMTASYAEDKTAEALVASKQKADMTYRQLMEIMGDASSMMHKGVIRENKQMVKEGANIILTHPAPNHRPWTIMPEEDQDGFKQSLLAYDKILDSKARRVIDRAEQGSWVEASSSLHELNAACISCHAMWRQKAVR